MRWLSTVAIAGATLAFTITGRVAAGAEPSRAANAIWLWQTRQILTDRAAFDRFFAFVTEMRIQRVFMQLPYHEEHPAGASAPAIHLTLQSETRAFLGRAHREGIRVEALDGEPEFAVASQHPLVLAIVRALIDFNRGSPAQQQFDGFHLDVEPYLLLGFDSPDRVEIIRGYVTLLREVAAAARSGALPLGIDIPFWYKTEDASCGDAPTDLARCVLRIADEVCIMDYRIVAPGHGGIVGLATPILREGDELGKRVYVGIETTPQRRMSARFVYGVTEAQWDALALQKTPLMTRSRINGIPLAVFDDGARRHVGVLFEDGTSDSAKVTAALAKLYPVFGATAAGRAANLARIAGEASAALLRSRDYASFKPFEFMAGALRIAGFETTTTPSLALSFAGRSRREMDAVLKQAAIELAENRSFAAFAIHDFSGYSTMPP
jgi:hypothetical protein